MSTPLEDGRSLAELIKGATSDVSTLVRGEIELAKAEVRETVKLSGQGVGMIAAAVFLILLAVVLLSVAAAYGLVAAGLDPWLAFLIVAVVYLIVAAILGLVARSQLKKAKAPERTIESVKQLQSALRPGT